MVSPFDKTKEVKKEASEKLKDASSTSPSSAPEVKKADVEVEVKQEEKMILVETLVDLPSYKGKRYPKGRQLMVPKIAFNKDLMKKM